MGRRGSNDEESISKDRIEEVRKVMMDDDKKKKKIYLSFLASRKKGCSWVEVNPDNQSSDNIASVDYMTRGSMNSPPRHLDVSRLIHFATVALDSKVYFIGGRFIANHDFTEDYVYSDKIFTYDLTSGDWNELPCKLNTPRSLARLVLLEAPRLIYVVGGISYNQTRFDSSRRRIAIKEHWIECLDLNNNNAAVTFLPPPPPDAVFDDYLPLYQFSYDIGHQIVFVMPKAGSYSFHYLSNTWAPTITLPKNALVECCSVVVIGHLLFWHYYGVMYAYHLADNRLLLDQTFEELDTYFGRPFGLSTYPSFLLHVDHRSLVLAFQDGNARTNDRVFYQFQIEGDHDPDLRLVQKGRAFFPTPRRSYLDTVLVA